MIVKKILPLSLAILIGLLVVAMPVLAISVTEAVYIADVVAYNTGTAITNGVAAVVPINTQALIDGKYVTSDLLNTALQTPGGSDVPYMPGVGTNPWVFWIPSIGAGEQKSYSFYAGGPAMQTGFYYFPASGGMTSADNNTSLEPGNNFQIEQKGYVDTSAGSDKTLVYKANAFKLYIQGANAIRSTILTATATDAATQRPNGVGDETNITSHIPLAVQGAVADDGGVQTNETTAANEATANDMILLPAVPAVNDAYYFGGSVQFATMVVNIGTQGVGTWTVTWEYWNGSAWTALGGVTDNTNAFKAAVGNQNVTFTLPSTWQTTTVKAISAYWVRARVATYSAVTTQPKGTQAWVGAHWQAVSDNSDASYVYTTSTSYLRDLYACADSNLSLVPINSVTIYFRIRSNSGAGSTSAKPAIKIGTVTYDGTEQSQAGISWATKSQVYNTSPATSVAWTWTEVDSMQIGLSLHTENSAHQAQCSDIWIVVNYNADTEVKAVTVTGVSSGELIVKTTAAANVMTLSVTNYAGTHQGPDSPKSVDITGVSVPNNSNTWSFITNGSMPYMDYHKISCPSTTLTQHIVYERDTIFDDLTENNNDATPTFVTTSSDPDVTAIFQNFRPIKENICSASLTEETPEMLTTPPEVPTGFYTEGSVNHLPGAQLINNLLDAGGIPQDLFWLPFCFGLAALASVFSYYFLRSMLFISIIGGVIILFFAATGAIPLWTFLIYAIIAIGVLVSERTFGW
jgi:hypothetical protein